MEKFLDKLIFEDNIIYYKPATYDGWQIPINELKILGEITTSIEAGNDWFFVFVINKNDWRVATAYIEENIREKFFKDISIALEIEPMTPKLFSSTKWDSSILYPKEFQGEKFMKLEELSPKGFWENLKIKLGLGKPYTLVLVEDIKRKFF